MVGFASIFDHLSNRFEGSEPKSGKCQDPIEVQDGFPVCAPLWPDFRIWEHMRSSEKQLRPDRTNFPPQGRWLRGIRTVLFVTFRNGSYTMQKYSTVPAEATTLGWNFQTACALFLHATRASTPEMKKHPKVGYHGCTGLYFWFQFVCICRAEITHSGANHKPRACACQTQYFLWIPKWIPWLIFGF